MCSTSSSGYVALYESPPPVDAPSVDAGGRDANADLSPRGKSRRTAWTRNIRPVSGGIYLVRGDDELVEMRETPYEAEHVLQTLIAKFPSLLSGDAEGAEVP